ncbi:MAG TPA: hypothetical protein VF705_09515, partial [Longimicrobium sp.]
MNVPFTLSPQAAFVAALIVKATLLLAAAGLATLALSRRAPAAARHLVWTLSVCGLLALPLLSIATPAWRLPFVTVRTAVADGPGTPRAVAEPGTPVVYAPAAPAV